MNNRLNAGRPEKLEKVPENCVDTQRAEVCLPPPPSSRICGFYWDGFHENILKIFRLPSVCVDQQP